MSEDEDVWQVVESRRRRPRRGSFSKTTYQHQSRGGGGSISTVPGGSSNTSNTPIQGAYTYTVTHQLPEKKADELVKRELKRLEQIKVLMRETTLWGRVVNGLRTVFLQLGLEQADYPWDESTADVPTNLEDSQGSSPNENESELMGAHPPPTAPAKTPAPAAPLPRLEELVCYGIGSFSESHNSRYQLALALCLRDLLSFPLEPQRAPPSGSYGFSTNGAEKNPGSEDNRARASFEVPSAEEASFPLHPEKCPAPPLQKQKQPASREGVDKGAASSGCRGSWGPRPMLRMVVFDPVMTETDKAVLVALGCIIPHDENGKRCCYAGDGGDNGAAASGSSRAKATPTLFFMPHCPWRLYSNVLWANWFPEAISSVIILGNALSAYRENIHLIRKADPSNALLRTGPLFQDIRLICHMFKTAKSSRYENADRLPHFWTSFNELTLSYSSPESRSSAEGRVALADRPPEDMDESLSL